jgi:hypothetical protein
MAICLCAACTSATLEPVEEGIDYNYLFNTQKFMLSQVAYHKENTANFCELVNKDDKLTEFDTMHLRATMIDWRFYINALMSLNMHDSAYNKVYKMTQNFDTVNRRIDILYLPLYDNLPLKKMMLTFDQDHEELRTLYAEYSKVGFWKDISRKVTFSKDEVLQVQEVENPLLGSAKSTVRKLIFASLDTAATAPAILQH